MTSQVSKEENPSTWCTEVKHLQIAWDSTSLKDFQTCPYLYKLHIIDGWVPRRRPPALHFGIAYHRGIEVYERAKADGLDFNGAVIKAIRAAAEAWGDFASDDKRRTLYTLIRGLIWYADKWIEDPAETIILPSGKPAVELSFQVPLPWQAPDGTQYLMCGHIDRLVKLGDDIRVSDAKTTVQTLSSSYFRRYDLDTQMDVYDFFGRVIFPEGIAGILIDGMQTAVTFSRYERWFSDRKPGQREEWFTQLEYWLSLAELFAQRDAWPQNKTSCSKYGGCRYCEVCEKEPAVRHVVLESDFMIETWNPLEPRGE
jgi:hypothetical protein